MEISKQKENYTMYDTTQLQSCGEDVRIHASVSIRQPKLVRLGNHIAIDEYAVFTTALELGDYIHISPHVTIIGGKKGLLKMGSFTNISAGGRIVCVSDSFQGEGFIFAPGIPEKFLDQTKSDPVIFEDFVNTGVNVIVLPGITLAEGSVIGAGALVTKNTEPWTIYAGVPAKPIKIRKKENIMRFAKEMGYRE